MAIVRGAFNELLGPQMEEMFRGRKVPMTPWDRWKERWTPNWLRWLFPVRYRVVNFPNDKLFASYFPDPNSIPETYPENLFKENKDSRPNS